MGGQGLQGWTPLHALPSLPVGGSAKERHQNVVVGSQTAERIRAAIGVSALSSKSDGAVTIGLLSCCLERQSNLLLALLLLKHPAHPPVKHSFSLAKDTTDTPTPRVRESALFGLFLTSVPSALPMRWSR